MLPFALPHIDGSDESGVLETLRSGWLTTGPQTKAFEQEFATAVGAEHAIAVNSCTAALELALAVADVHEGDEVITSPYTFAATAEVIRRRNARPVFADINRRTLNIDPACVEEVITPRTKAIVPVHIGGLPADMDALLPIAERHGIRVIEDAAHAFPASYRGRRIGSLSDFTCFSFYATKTMTTGEGGMLCTNDTAAAERARRLALHGISNDAWRRNAAADPWRYEIVEAGYKSNMSDIAAALGRSQLRRGGEMRDRRRQIAEAYDKAFGERDTVETPYCPPDVEHSWHLYTLRLRPERLDVGRDEVIRELRACNIGTSVHFIPLHHHRYYQEAFGYDCSQFPVASSEYQREVSLPIYSKMTDGDVQDVIDAVSTLLDAHTL